MNTYWVPPANPGSLLQRGPCSLPPELSLGKSAWQAREGSLAEEPAVRRAGWVWAQLGRSTRSCVTVCDSCTPTDHEHLGSVSGLPGVGGVCV